MTQTDLGTSQAQRGYPTATAAAQAQLASAFYSAQALLAAMSVRDVIALWQQLDLRDVRSSWPALRVALAALIENRFGMSAAQAAAYYAEARRAAGVVSAPVQFRLPPLPIPGAPVPLTLPAAPSPFASLPPLFPGRPATPVSVPAVVEVPAPSPQLIDATLDSTGPWSLLARIKQGQPLTQAAENTAVVMSGAASRLVQNGAREVVLQAVQADAEAVAWRRVTAANPCSFCAMLASRIDYKTEASAGFKAHNHCRCTAAPVFSRQDAEAMRDNDLYQQWKQVTRGYSGKDALNAWRRYWDDKMRRDGIRVLPAA